MKKLLLINPVGRKSGFLLSKFSTFPPLGLAYVAAVTPTHWNVKILDENISEFEFEEADLVGITSFTTTINRAYEIASIYREKSIKVVIGGIHASMVPDEVLNYADSVVIGEVEKIWDKVINDFENNRLSPKYIGPRIDFSNFNVRPRRDLIHSDYFWNSIQTSRGCPFNCNFCSVSRYLGKEYRQRKPNDIIEELKEIKGKYIAFMDDNFVGYNQDSKNRAKEVFRGMINGNFKKRFGIQTSINADDDDDEVVELASKAGCMFAFIGFESINEYGLIYMGKRANLKIGVKNYSKVVDKFHKHGIAILGAFIIANDYESREYYKQLAEFIVRSKIDIVQISFMTPLPGTKLMEQLKKESRLIYQDFPSDWDKYRMSYIVYTPHGLDIPEIYAGSNYIKNYIYSFPTYQYRILKSFFSLKNPGSFYASYKFNQAYKKAWLNSHYYNNHPVK